MHYGFNEETRLRFPQVLWNGQLFTAETFQQFLQRIQKVLEHDFPQKTLFVSHGAVVYTLADILIDGTVLKERYGQVTNASVTKISGKSAKEGRLKQ